MSIPTVIVSSIIAITIINSADTSSSFGKLSFLLSAITLMINVIIMVKEYKDGQQV